MGLFFFIAQMKAKNVKLPEQNEKIFPKQPHIFLGKYQRVLAKSNKTTKNVRYYKNVGLGIKTPKEAINGTYIDKKCPWTGDVSIRGRILRGVCASTKMNRTIIVRRDYLHYVRKYSRFEKRHTNIPAHLSPCFRAKVGDVITLGQCRPLSKTVRFNVLKVEENALASAQKKKQFRCF